MVFLYKKKLIKLKKIVQLLHKVEFTCYFINILCHVFQKYMVFNQDY